MENAAPARFSLGGRGSDDMYDVVARPRASWYFESGDGDIAATVRVPHRLSASQVGDVKPSALQRRVEAVPFASQVFSGDG